MNIIDESTHKITAEEVASIFSREFFGLTRTSSNLDCTWLKNYIIKNLEFINANWDFISEALRITSPKDFINATDFFRSLISQVNGEEL